MSQSQPIIAPCLWYDHQAEEAGDFYARVFSGARVTGVSTYPTGFDNPGGLPRGSVLTVELEIGGRPFTLVNGGPFFRPNPSISFFVSTGNLGEVERMAAALADGGHYLMELGEYPWSARYAWVADRYSVSWQVMHDEGAGDGPRIMPCLMFAGAVHGRAEEALRQYSSIFPGGTVEALEHYGPGEGPEETIKHGRALLGGQPLVAMDSHGAHDFGFDEGVSLQVYCADQAEVDHFWEKLSDGGEEGPCGWLKDRFGVSWQVVPTAFVEMMKAGAAVGPGYERVFQAMLEMRKLDVAALQAAYDGAA